MTVATAKKYCSHIIDSLLTSLVRSVPGNIVLRFFLVPTLLSALARSVLKNLSPIFHGTDLTLGQ